MNTVKFGVTAQLQQNLVGRTVGSVLNDANIAGALGFGTNVVCKVRGVVVENNYVIREGDELDIETRANQKAK